MLAVFDYFLLQLAERYALFQLAHIDLRRVKEYTLHEVRRPVHLHLDDELALVVGLATYVNYAVLSILRS